ncbi:MAG: type II toxin-antitoxin system HicA family toxin [Candidatus Sabulitectum sp.]|nr:type II toxin-antitoxin system HicA family toxin [Candidatus Sabulitectum sp.]
MGKNEKLYEQILLGRSDANTAFSRLCILLGRLGFNERIRGDHHIFTKRGVEEIPNLQPREGKAKSYQVKQVRNIILKYDLRIGE